MYPNFAPVSALAVFDIAVAHQDHMSIMKAWEEFLIKTFFLKPKTFFYSLSEDQKCHCKRGYIQESLHHIIQSKSSEFSRYGRVKYNIDR